MGTDIVNQIEAAMSLICVLHIYLPFQTFNSRGAVCMKAGRDICTLVFIVISQSWGWSKYWYNWHLVPEMLPIVSMSCYFVLRSLYTGMDLILQQRNSISGNFLLLIYHHKSAICCFSDLKMLWKQQFYPQEIQHLIICQKMSFGDRISDAVISDN